MNECMYAWVSEVRVRIARNGDSAADCNEDEYDDDVEGDDDENYGDAEGFSGDPDENE